MYSETDFIIISRETHKFHILLSIRMYFSIHDVYFLTDECTRLYVQYCA